MAASYQALPGMFDVLAPESARYSALVARFAAQVERAGYGLIVSPVMEEYELFQRVGTEIVRKEMYELDDRGGRHLVLRPEGTAPVMRAYLQHKPTTPFKAWYLAPNFRYERPQALRYRQHHQIGVEAIGSDDPDLDVEVIALLHALYADVGLRRVTLLLNSLGDSDCRPAYREKLLGDLRPRHDQLCDEHKERYEENPLRVLDCKKPPCRAATADAPTQIANLCEACSAHFERVKRGLDAVGVTYEVAPRLVRGLDYYTRTTFEFAADALESAQNGIGGGGRYDGLAEELGGPATPGIGFGAGIERILGACDAEGVFATPAHAPRLDVFVIDTTGGEAARDLGAELRVAAVATDRAFDNRSFKAQMKTALRSGARFALVIDPDHMEIRTLLEKGEPEKVERADAVSRLKERLAE